MLVFLVVVGGYLIYRAPYAAAPLATSDVHYKHSVATGQLIQPIPMKMKADPRWIRLGRMLFHSRLLSRDNTTACSSCHIVEFGGDHGLPVSIGVGNQTGTRNTPTVLNAVFNSKHSWDGHNRDLHTQVEASIQDSQKMGGNWADIIRKLKSDQYIVDSFQALSDEGVSPSTIVEAMVVYQSSLITPNSAFDRYLLGDRAALTDQQVRGYQKFKRYGCIDCHKGRNMGGNSQQKINYSEYLPSSLSQDLGLYHVSQKEEDKYVFKVPGLRNITLTAPYFHNGSVDTLEEAVTLMGLVQLGLELSYQDIDDIVNFLGSLTGELIVWDAIEHD